MHRAKYRRASRPAVEGLERRENPSSLAPAPHVVSVQRAGIHHQRSTVVLTFDQPMSLSSTRNAGNYLLQARDAQGRFDGNPPQTIRVLAAIYNATNQTVTLYPRQRLNAHRSYQLTVNGNLAGPASAQGIVLEGNAGPGGGNYTVVLPPLTASASRRT